MANNMSHLARLAVSVVSLARQGYIRDTGFCGLVRTTVGAEDMSDGLQTETSNQLGLLMLQAKCQSFYIRV